MTDQATTTRATSSSDANSGNGMTTAEALSAWVDGELPGAVVRPLWVDADGGAQPSLQAWHRYHLIGDVLRATAETPFSCSDAALSAEKATSAAQHIMAQAQLQPAETGAVVAALPVTQPSEAANDGVFRWKMVSGFASVAAVLSLAWGLGTSPVGPAAGVDLAQSTPAVVAIAGQPPVVADAKPGLPADAVLVSTTFGPVLRDARLEELMQAHRQAGGANALQAPAGFLRNATFDGTQR